MQISIKSNKRVEFADITPQINNFIKNSDVSSGAVLIFTKHTTTGLTINENESGLVEDMEGALKRLIPEVSGYKHNRIDNNADAHLRSLLLEHSLVIPFSDGRLDLGRWQSVFFIELDGPRTRLIGVKII